MMFTYKVFFNEPKAVWGQGCVLVQAACEATALQFFTSEFPGYQATRIYLTFDLPI
ncbi:hypothetical protein [Spirosoma agri]|uniref:Uncharacterized protein n=1 Tax=Spirosoma agri TaxID=1987381 RepID=A0A6M0IH98_9BACT|nr:hypothetical protein [Spirosoma agri]NEU67075.1 hypothetical protein [Spirosoma agri]